MAQDYDKIFKENIEQIILPLAEKILQIHPEKLVEIPDDLQRTIERKPDFLKKVAHKDHTKDYILHLEFQTKNEPKMVYRMHEYYALLLRKYELDVYQSVFYLQSKKAQMPTRLQKRHLDFQFDLINVQDFDYQTFINSNTPEEIILAILGNFGQTQATVVIQSVLEKLKSTTQDTTRREKCVKQLEILSNLRNLQAEIIKQLERMALTYDLEKDIRFKQGIEKGKIEVKVLGIQKALKRGRLSLEEIAEDFEVSLDFVLQVKKGEIRLNK
ncbi:MAG: hypothetical protein MUE85_21455 [Microscillaceae bacterium]|jgi:hypothetical protein|nr:hypothetical protein [Microscillaceae bacterium]